MERIIYRKTLDLHKSGVQFTLQGFQTADNMARTLELSLMASGDTIDLPLEQLIAVMYLTTPNATEPSINECTIRDNTVVCDVPPIVEEGITNIQLKLIETSTEGAKSTLATPELAIEVSKSNTNEEGATQNTTFTALESALARAKGVYDARFLRIELDSDCMFRAYYADGTVYESDVLKELFHKGEALLSQSYARGGTGVRTGEDTDNSMYYSQVSKSASIEANASTVKAKELLEETRKHGVYTAFSIDFETGEVEYVSPSYKFQIDKISGDLEAIGEAYTFEETIQLIVMEWLNENGANIALIQERLNAHETSISTLTSFAEAHENELELLNVLVDDIKNTTIPSIEESIRNNDTDISSLSQTVATNKSDVDEEISNINTNVSNIKVDVANLKAESNQYKSNIETLQTNTNQLMKSKSGIVNIGKNGYLFGNLSYVQTNDMVNLHGKFAFTCSDFLENGVATFRFDYDVLPFPNHTHWVAIPVRFMGEGFSPNDSISYGSMPICIKENGDLILYLTCPNGVTSIEYYFNVMYPIEAKG